jgi:hypothetical protein
VSGSLASLAGAPIKPIGVVRSPFPTRMGTPRSVTHHHYH